MAGTRNIGTPASGTQRKSVPKVRQTKMATGGNAPCDRDWIVEIGDDLTKIDPNSLGDDIFWDVALRFEGYASEVDPEFFEYYRRGSRKCSGTAYIRDERGGYILDWDDVRLTRPCLAPPMHGSAVCHKHGGETAHIKNAARNRLDRAAEMAANTLIVLAQPHTEDGELVEQNVRLKAANSVLDRVGIKPGVEVEVQIPGYKKVLQDLFSDDNADE